MAALKKLEMREHFFAFSPCPARKISLFKMQSSFERGVFRSGKMIKHRAYWRMPGVFHVAWTVKGPFKT
ncbi:MAG: hypothetical protein ACOYJY_01655 [Acutalibacteraceae bacterium]|jgi:hypothetical protein